MFDLFGFPPKVFLIGSQKSGTTLLADLLGQHPDICLANPKEPALFTRNWTDHLDDHLNVFANLEKILIDASTSYSCAPLPTFFKEDIGKKSKYSGVPSRIFKTCPESKFIYIMRDPVDRTYSSYWHQVRAGLETRSLFDAIDNDTYYLRTSHYFGQISLYLKYFNKDQFLFLLFEEFIKNPLETVRKCFNFLNIEANVNIIIKRAQNKSFVYSGFWKKLNIILAEMGGLNVIIKKTRPFIPGFFLKLASKVMIKSIPKIPQNEVEYILPKFNEANQMLLELLNRKSLPWRY